MEFFDNDVAGKLKKEEESRKTHHIWAEKYRPLNLSDFVGNDILKAKMKHYIEDNDIPHLLFYGKAGGGKTTLANILAKNIDCDSIYINASSENSIDDVRNKIVGFASSVGFRPLKIIILDEADFLTPQAQAALRNVMETFSMHTRFILTCNYFERIIEPIISRVQLFELVPPSKKDVASHVFNILRKESVEALPIDLKFILDSLYPDIRRIINTLQKQTRDNKLEVDQKAMVDSDYKLKIIDILKDTKKEKKDAFKEIRQILADNSITSFFDMYRLMYDNVDEYAKGHIAQSLLIISENQYKDSFVTDHEISFMALITQLLDEIKTK